MKKEPYLPKSDGNKRVWLSNFNTQIASLGPGLGVTAVEITAIDEDTKAVNYMMDNLEIFNKECEERTKYKDLLFGGEIGSPLGDLPGLPLLPSPPASVPAGVFRRIAKLVQRIKNHPDYNEALGKNLGIIGADKPVDYENLKVQITLRRTDADGVTLDFVKGQMDGVVVYSGTIVQQTLPAGSMDGGGTEPPLMAWDELARVTTSPFVDARSNEGTLPEARYYKMRYFKKDIPVGKESDVLSVIAVKFKSGTELSGKVK